VTLDELLASILGSGQQQPNRLANWRGPDATPNMLVGAGMPQGGMRETGMAPDPVQTAAAPPQQASGGGSFLSRLFGGGGNPALNETADWLVKQGYDPGTARGLAGNKEAMQRILVGQVGGNKPLVINGKLVDPQTYEVLADFSDPKGAEGFSLSPGERRYDASGRLIASGAEDVKTRTMTPEEVKAAGLAPGVWQIDEDNNIKKAGDAAPVPGAPFRFDGTSVEGQALNGLIDSGALTVDQAQQLAAGKTITNPADGSIVFLTPRGIFSQPAGGGAAQPVGASPAEPVPGAPPPASVTGPGSVPSPVASPPAVASPGSVLPPNSGIIPITGGKPGKLATEAETRNRALYTVAAPELRRVEENFEALANVYDQAASNVLPWGTDNYLTSPEYQRATNALKMVAQTFLYSASGQAAPAEEVNKIVNALTPRPGESPESIADKKERLKTMVSAIRQAGGNWTPPTEAAPTGGNVRQIAPGVTIEKLN
jgi:hypothetical protein